MPLLISGKFKRLITVLLVSLTFTGHVLSKSNNVLTNTSNAKLRFYSPQEIETYKSLVIFRQYKGDRCFGSKELMFLGSNATWRRTFNDIDIGMLKDPNNTYNLKHYFEIVIPAGTKYVFTAEGKRSLKNCLIRTSFVPLENMEYEATYQSDATRCWIDIDRIQSHDGKFKRETEESRVVIEPDCTKW